MFQSMNLANKNKKNIPRLIHENGRRSSVFCSKFNWKSHSWPTKQWKKLQVENISIYMSICSRKPIFPPQIISCKCQFGEKKHSIQNTVFGENLWWPLVGKILASSNSSSSSLSWPPTKLSKWLGKWRFPNSKSKILDFFLVLKKHSNLWKLEECLDVGTIWDSPTGFKMPKILPGHMRTEGKLPGKRTFWFPQCFTEAWKDFGSQFSWQRNLSKWCPVWLHQLSSLWPYWELWLILSWKILEIFGDWIGLDMILNHPRDGGFTHLMISCHWISNLERNKMCVSGGLIKQVEIAGGQQHP